MKAIAETLVLVWVGRFVDECAVYDHLTAIKESQYAKYMKQTLGGRPSKPHQFDINPTCGKDPQRKVVG
ncbi:MAG: hypothetical protein ACI4J3_02290 [Oscillospiraceae bacterium]